MASHGKAQASFAVCISGSSGELSADAWDIPLRTSTSLPLQKNVLNRRLAHQQELAPCHHALDRTDLPPPATAKTAGPTHAYRLIDNQPDHAHSGRPGRHARFGRIDGVDSAPAIADGGREAQWGRISVTTALSVDTAALGYSGAPRVTKATLDA